MQATTQPSRNYELRWIASPATHQSRTGDIYGTVDRKLLTPIVARSSAFSNKILITVRTSAYLVVDRDPTFGSKHDYALTITLLASKNITVVSVKFGETGKRGRSVMELKNLIEIFTIHKQQKLMLKLNAASLYRKLFIDFQVFYLIRYNIQYIYFN
ncbi:hypothetical protein SS50377_22685 [Spironucleus salmonicida]|uniref:Uncharacterized protein n=2 Tax=Spironucleus salmonicida TaxID=348837 RepID=A0A9P8LVJ8_9EUKA|nr:hypothetical protein SS50377_22685 [Spironucleus salmonicida]